MSTESRVVPTPIDVGIGAVRLLVRTATRRVQRTGGSGSVRYCYAVWLRHLTMAAEAGLSTDPRSIVELGPGDSIGVGLAALLTGAQTYVALDRVAFARRHSNLAIFDGLVDLLRARSAIPDHVEFPEVRPLLEDYRFPEKLLSRSRLAATLEPDRVARLRRALTIDDGTIRYVAPWDDVNIIPSQSADVIISQAVLEHVENLGATYLAMARWLRPGGFLSHQIDFRSHNTSTAWNGHWAYSERQWGLVGGRPRLINRQPLSAHRAALEKARFRLVTVSVDRDRRGIGRDRLDTKWTSLTADDLTASGAFIQAST